MPTENWLPRAGDAEDEDREWFVVRPGRRRRLLEEVEE